MSLERIAPLPPSRMKTVAAQAAQILVGGLGGLVAHSLGVPAAWLSGSVLAVVLWGALGFGTPIARPLADAAMLVSGVSMGAGVTPEAIAAIGRYPFSLAFLAVGILASTIGSMMWLTRVSGWRRDDALLASAPGAFSTALAIALDRDAAVAQIAVVQTFRIFVLITVLPSIVVLIGGGSAMNSLVQAQRSVASPLAMAVVLVGGLALGIGFERLRVAAPILLGGTVVSSLFHATAWAPGFMPPVVATAGLVLIGVFIAERFARVERDALRETIPAAAGSFLISMMIAAGFAALAALAAKVAVADSLVAFAPGGLEAMMVLALVLGLDPLYVGVHHLARFLGIGVVLPFVFAWLRRSDDAQDAPAGFQRSQEGVDQESDAETGREGGGDGEAGAIGGHDDPPV